MKLFRICISLLVAGSATVALGQYGIYGSPDPIQVSQQTPGMAPSGGYASPSVGYPAAANYPVQKPMQPYSVQQTQPYASQPVSPYANQPMPAYANQPVQSYTSQPMPAYATQQMQPARPVATYGQVSPQYKPPTYSTPTYYTAAADQASMTQPSTQPVMTVPSGMPMQQQAAVIQSPVMQKPAEPATPPYVQQTPGVMNQMLTEQGQCGAGCAGGCEGYAPVPGQCGNYRPYINRYEQSACGSCDSCSEGSLWYASISALVMTRDRPNKVYLTYETGNLPHNDFPVDEFSWRWGGEVRIGRRFCGGCNSGCNNGCNSCCNTGYWALEASYWTLDDFDSFVSHTSPVSATNPNGTVGTPLRISDIQFSSTPGTTWFDNAAEHRLWRRDELHNVELNLVRGQWCYGQDSPWDLGWSMGVRYFRFQESWRFGSLAGPGVDPLTAPHFWGQSGGLYEAYLTDGITNNLVGPQLGFELGYSMGYNFRFFMAPKVGIYDNHISNNFQAYLGNGTGATTGTSGVPGTYPVNSSTDTISFLTQIDVGVDWRFARQWSAQVGYRVVAVSSIGLADAQIPFYIVDIPAIADIDKNSDLILHGAFATIAYNF
jgi:hypothetical protein